MGIKRGLRQIVGGSDGADLEAISDKLLRDSGSLGKESGIYTEIQMTRQDIRHAKQDSMEAVFEARRLQFTEVDNTLIESAWADIKYAARRKGIPDYTLKMIEMRRQKMTYEEIAVAFSEYKKILVSPKAVEKRVLRARELIMELPEYGMWETINKMTVCWISNWLRIFGEEMKLRENN